MKRKAIFAIVILIIIFGACLGVYKYKLSLRESSPYEIPSFDEARAVEDEKYLCDLGLTYNGILCGRLTGTEAEHKGARYILEQFEEAGLTDAHIEEYPVMMFEVNSVSVSLVHYLSGPLGNGIPDPTTQIITFEHIKEFVCQGYSGSLDWQTFRDDLEVINIGDGRNESDYEDITGKAVILRIGTSSASGAPANSELFFKAWEHGAAAIILHNIARGEEHGFLPIFKTSPPPASASDSSYPDIPFFMVSKRMGDEINRHIADYKIRVEFDITIEERNLNVVVGDIRGTSTRYSNEFVLMGAHHDTVYNGPGAVDNTAGTVTIIGLARGLANSRPARTIRLCTFGGEEEGLFGSTLYFEKHKDDILSNCKMMLNFDMCNVDLERGNGLPISVSDNDTIRIMSEIAEQVCSEERFQKYDVSIHWSSLKSAGSDQWIFANNDMTVSCCWGSGCAEYHTYLDTIEHQNAESQALSAKICGGYALYLANK